MPLARLRGVVEDKGADWLIVAAGSLGLYVSVPASTADDFAVGARASLFTHLHVREDALTLFGFRTADDLRLFEQLIGVSGVGPRVALGLLSSMPTNELASSIVGGRADALRKVPGVGQKTAERIVLDLRDKVTPPIGSGIADETAQPQRQPDADLIAALTALGYSSAEATDAAARLRANGDAPLEDRIREALALFTST